MRIVECSILPDCVRCSCQSLVAWLCGLWDYILLSGLYIPHSDVPARYHCLNHALRSCSPEDFNCSTCTTHLSIGSISFVCLLGFSLSGKKDIVEKFSFMIWLTFQRVVFSGFLIQEHLLNCPLINGWTLAYTTLVGSNAKRATCLVLFFPLLFPWCLIAESFIIQSPLFIWTSSRYITEWLLLDHKEWGPEVFSVAGICGDGEGLLWIQLSAEQCIQDWD